MLVIVGYVVVILCVFGGYALAGGYLAALWHPIELIIIGGGAIGAFVVGTNSKALKATLSALPTVFKGSKYTRALYLDMMALLYELLTKIRKEGLMSVEADVDSPENSPLFTKYPTIMADHPIVEFLTDYLRLMVSGSMNAFEIENLMDNEIETHPHEGEVPVHAVGKIGDGLPAFGIIAAVMGVVKTMGSVGLPPAELGILIGAALTGTFIGILLAYGFVSPLATLLEQKLHESTKMFQCVKVTLLASINGDAPAIAVEFGRKVLFSTERPSFSELETYVRSAKSR